MAAMLLAPVIVVVLVAVGYVYLKSSPAPSAGSAASHNQPTVPPPSPAPTLGQWKHIESRTQDPAPLTATALFPQQFSKNGAAAARTVDKTSTKCSRDVIGSTLAAAVRKADCSQVLRASYLSTDRKIMATIGVLNLRDATTAGHVGKVAGSVAFIKPLAAAHGPTRNLTKGTGIEEAEVKGHYLILIWTEFSNLHAPSSKAKRQQLESFSAGLIAGTANVSLTNRMVTGKP